MADTSRDEMGERAVAIAKLLAEHKGGGSVALDLRSLNAWTDFYVIATVTSTTHLQGLQRRIKEFADGEGIDILHRQKKIPDGDEWNLTDIGGIVIHLMSERARSFYELERLWHQAVILWKDEA